VAVRFGNVNTLDRLGPVSASAKLFVQLPEEGVPRRSIQCKDLLARHAIHTGSAVVSQHQRKRGPQHVVPVNPVKQSVEPESGFLFGLVGQFSSQFRDFLRQHDPGLHFWSSQSLIPVQATVFFRSGTFVQADLLTSDENVRSAGALRSAGVTPVQRYYDPLRLPAASSYGYLFPTPVARAPCHGALARGRISQVPRRSFDARRPLPPRVAHPLQMLVASRMMSGFNIFGRLTTTRCVTRPKRVRLRYG
jgi:hypothetical protein